MICKCGKKINTKHDLCYTCRERTQPPKPEGKYAKPLMLRRDFLVILGWPEGMDLFQAWEEWGKLLQWLYSCGTIDEVAFFLGMEPTSIIRDMRQLKIKRRRKGVRQ